MRVARSGKPGRSPILDVLEDFTFYTTPGSSATAKPLVLAGSVDQATANYLFQGTGGIAPTVGVTQNAGMSRQFPPGSAQTSVAGCTLGMPIGRDLSRFPLSVRQQKRYVWDTLIQRTVALTATAEFFIGLADDLVAIGTPPGAYIGIRSLTSENAGRWTSKYNLLNGGAGQSLGDSGIAPDGTPQHFRFEYFDITPSPVLQIYINGVVKFRHIGATLPTWDGNEPWSIMLCAGSAAHVIGQQDYNFYNRIFVELL